MADIAEPVLNKKPIYDLIDSVFVISKFIEEYGSYRIPDKAILDLKESINKLIPDYNIGILYLSDNTDKELFGIFINRRLDVLSLIGPTDMREIPEGNMNSFDIDIDSKLFTMGLEPREIASIILYDMYCILSHDATLDVVAVYDTICAGRESSLKNKIIGKVATENLFRFCASDYLYRARSIFTRDENELVRIPDILPAYDISADFEIAAEKIFKHEYMVCKKNNPPAALSMNWMMSAIYRHTDRSTEILDILRDFMDTSGSTLIKTLVKTIARLLVDINVKFFRREIATEASLFSGIRKSGMKSLENDLFEYEMRVKNIEDENSAIFLMRQINSRISIIQDYLEEEKIPEAEMKRWQKLYDRYEKLRIQMTNKPIYSRKMYGLFVDYNALMSQNNDNMMTMNTIY